MLPFHVQGNGDLRQTSRLNSFGCGRPALRWISWVLVSIGFLWICGALFVNFAPPPLHGYIPSVDTLLRGGHPHPSYYTPHTPVPQNPHKPLKSHPTSSRADQVRQAFLHAYSGYQKQALLYDELLPVDGGKVNK